MNEVSARLLTVHFDIGEVVEEDRHCVVINPTNVIGVYTLEEDFEIIANESGMLTKRIPVHRLLSNPASMVVMGKRGK